MLLRHLRANTVAYLALLVALGTGTAYAADQIANGSVTTKKLAKDAVTSPKIKKNAVRSADVKDGALTAADITDGSVTSADVHDGTLVAADLATGVLPPGLGIVADAQSSAPAATPDVPTVSTRTFTTTGGSAYVQLAVNSVGLDCTAGTPNLGLYVDGVPVPDTRVTLPGASATQPRVVSAQVAVGPGAHTASIGVDCPASTFGSLTFNGAMWFVLAPI